MQRTMKQTGGALLLTLYLLTFAYAQKPASDKPESVGFSSERLRILSRHFPDQLTNLLVDLRTADRRLGLPSPVELESLPMPFDDGLRFDNDQDLPPILPGLREAPRRIDPADAVAACELSGRGRPVADARRDSLPRALFVARSGSG